MRSEHHLIVRTRRNGGGDDAGIGHPVFLGGNLDGQHDLAALMKQVADGDEAAFGQLYESVAGPVFGIVRAVVRDVAQSEEVTQEVLVEK